MGSGEPALVPEWYRAGKGGKTANANSDDNGVGLSSRNKVFLVTYDRDSARSSGKDVPMRSDKNSSAGARAYSNFGRRDRKKNLGLRDRDRDRSPVTGIGSHDYLDSVIGSRTDRDRLWQNSGSLGGRNKLWSKRLESDSKSINLSRENVSGGGIRNASSFKRDFPAIATVEKKGVLELGRVSNSVQSLPLSSSTTVGGDSWTSAFAEVPVVAGGNASTQSSVVQNDPVSPVALARINSTGLNMAEALIQASSQVRSRPQLSIDTFRADEGALRQCKLLVPLTPSVPKTSGQNSSEKSRFRGATKGGDFGGPLKSCQQLSSPVVNNALRAAAVRSDVYKVSQIGNFQVLCRDRTGISSAAKGAGSQDVNLKSSNPNLKAESKGTSTSLVPSSNLSLGSFGEKRPLSKAQKRNDFFNSLRKKTSINHSVATVIPEPSCCDTMEKSLSSEQNAGSPTDVSMVNQEENHGDGCFSDASEVNQEDDSDDSEVSCGDAADASSIEKQLDGSFPSQSAEDNGDKKESCCSDCNCHPAVDLDERDKAFLQSLGWKEDATEEALTAEEIAAFIKEYEKLRPYSKFSGRFEEARLSVAQTY